VIAPGFSSDESVRAALSVAAVRLRAVAPIESPDSGDLQAVTASFASLRGSRLYPIYPNVRLAGPIGVVGGSSIVAALIAKTDAQLGFWVSPSNRLCSSVVGLTHPVEFSLDPSSGESGANLLNKNKVATFVNEQGFRLWGNRTLFDEADALDSRHKFINVRRLRDFIDDAILTSHLWAVDRNITKSYVSQVTESINNYFRDLKAQEAILGGHCWIDPEVNTISQITDGHVTFDYEFTPPYPAERITFRSLLSDDHVKEVF
jgi:phage tail sheath protein FI